MRGSRPGERRGGRKKGTPNKKTAYVRAVTAAHAANPTVTPMDVMLAVMRDPHVALDMRLKMLSRRCRFCIESCVQVNPHLVPAMNVCLPCAEKSVRQRLDASISRRSRARSITPQR